MRKSLQLECERLECEGIRVTKEERLCERRETLRMNAPHVGKRQDGREERQMGDSQTTPITTGVKKRPTLRRASRSALHYDGRQEASYITTGVKKRPALRRASRSVLHYDGRQEKTLITTDAKEEKR